MSQQQCGIRFGKRDHTRGKNLVLGKQYWSHISSTRRELFSRKTNYSMYDALTVCCRYPLVSRLRQVLSPVGSLYGLSPMFEIWSWNAHVSLILFSTDEEKKHLYTLEYFVDVWLFSFLKFSGSLRGSARIVDRRTTTPCQTKKTTLVALGHALQDLASLGASWAHTHDVCIVLVE